MRSKKKMRRQLLEVSQCIHRPTESSYLINQNCIIGRGRFERETTDQSTNSTEPSNLNLKFVSILRIGYFVLVGKVSYASDRRATSDQWACPSTSAEQEHAIDAVPKKSGRAQSTGSFACIA